MLAWALWLASSLLEWVRWGWTCFSEGGLWRRKKVQELPSQEPPPAPEPDAPGKP